MALDALGALALVVLVDEAAHLVAVAVEGALQEDLGTVLAKGRSFFLFSGMYSTGGKGHGHTNASGERSALVPRHAVAQIIDADLLAAHAGAHARDAELRLAAVWHGDTHEGLASAAGARALGVVVKVVGELRLGRGALHLAGEPAARPHGLGAAVAVGDAARVDRVERDAHARAPAADRVLHEDELALLGFGDVAEELGGFALLVGFAAVVAGAAAREAVGGSVGGRGLGGCDGVRDDAAAAVGAGGEDRRMHVRRR